MRIDAYAQVQQLYQTKKVQKAEPAKKGGFSDQLQISSMGKDLQVAKSAVAQAPDVRADVVASLKEQINNGTYQVSGESFAEKVLEKYYSTGKL
ncbi:MAG: flagellar biosynthesis anti-sigma factor FlgM [Lachnospiraceae bacterium]|nr:flagellar biosynthesis anti-sigma factor FlgM [Lachnospiraceae bacterium]